MVNFINGIPVHITNEGTIDYEIKNVIYHKPRYKKTWVKQKTVQLKKIVGYKAFVVDNYFGGQAIFMHQVAFDKIKNRR